MKLPITCCSYKTKVRVTARLHPRERLFFVCSINSHLYSEILSRNCDEISIITASKYSLAVGKKYPFIIVFS